MITCRRGVSRDRTRYVSLIAAALVFSATTSCADGPLADPRLTEVWKPEPAVITPGAGTTYLE